MRAAKHYIAPVAGRKAPVKAPVAKTVCKRVAGHCSPCNLLILALLFASAFMASHWAAIVGLVANLIWMCKD